MVTYLSLKFVVDHQPIQREIVSFKTEILAKWRKSFIKMLARRILKQIILRNPVETARSRAAWVQALLELDALPPAGWQGTTALQPAIVEGKKSGSAEILHSGSQTEVRATNRVDYVPLLEYGTGRTAAFRMVQQSLKQTGIT